MNAFFQQVNNATLAAFRIIFGLMILAEIGWERDARVGLIESRPVRFPYMGFEWLQPLPSGCGEPFLACLSASCVALSLGLFFRAAVVAFTLGYTWMFLLDRAYFNNHTYLICMLGGWLAVSDANRRWSLDVLMWPAIRRTTVPAWQLYGLTGQIAVAYFFGGVAKINPDWLRGEPMRYFLYQLVDTPGFSVLADRPLLPVIFAWAGMLFDLLIVPALCWRRTRLPAIVAMTCFHVMNANMFAIGIFPWLSMGAIVLFLPPGCVERVVELLSGRPERITSGSLPSLRQPLSISPPARRLIVAACIAWFGIQCLVPLRRFLLPGNSGWTREGFYFAWTMKLDHKSSFLSFHACDPTSGVCRPVDYRGDLTVVQAAWLPQQPRGIAEYARFVDARLEAENGRPVTIVCDSVASLNGRPYQYMIDPRIDVADAPLPRFSHAEWIVPLALDEPIGIYPSRDEKERRIMSLVERTRFQKGIVPPALAGKRMLNGPPAEAAEDR
jgi:hypothetical protein